MSSRHLSQPTLNDERFGREEVQYERRACDPERTFQKRSTRQVFLFCTTL
jgi:hypothetical protein